GRLESLVYSVPPREFTRMHAVCRQAPGALVMDTSTAALLGALTDLRVKEAVAAGPLVLLNLGNQHTFAACLEQGRITGLFEHHTGMLTAEKTAGLLAELLAGKLTDDAVYAGGGHGCIPPPAPVRPVLTVITGPQREKLRHLPDSYFAAPQGNMMLMGCYGLIEAALRYR
ncbi:MAG TPA: DUF1786 domain-containing protein, partial [Firmicutes bacterium]|nr:DUF1786 domain-containing protein [Bacillota bacterium]